MKLNLPDSMTFVFLIVMQLLCMRSAAAANNTAIANNSCESACVGLADWAAQECALICRKPAAIKSVVCLSEVCAESLGCSTACQTEVGGVAVVGWGQLRRLVERQQQRQTLNAAAGDFRWLYAAAAMCCVVIALLAAAQFALRSGKLTAAVAATKKMLKMKGTSTPATPDVFTVERTGSETANFDTYQVAAQGEISTQRGQDGTVKDQTFQLQPQSRASIEDDASVIRGQTSGNHGQTSVLSFFHELGLPAVPPPCRQDSFYIYDDYRVYEDCSMASYNTYISVL
jgi:hypothetical protein